MKEGKDLQESVAPWVLKAENDFITAGWILKNPMVCPTDAVGFHSQQCIEKYLKAMLTYLGIAFPKTHEIDLLLQLLPESLRPAMTTEEIEKITDYATVNRYPGAGPEISKEEARRAVKTARRVRTDIRRLLPRGLKPLLRAPKARAGRAK